MPSALQFISGRATAPGTTFTALTPNKGDSFTISNAPLGSRVVLANVNVFSNASGVLRIRSPKLHDNAQGIRLRHNSGNPRPLLPFDIFQKLYPQDTLTAEITGSATAGQIEVAGFWIYYADLPGVASRFIDPATLKTRAVNIFTVESALTLGTTGDYSGEKTINSDFDLFKANTDYALLGAMVDADILAVGYRGADTGNLRVAVPGVSAQKDLTKNWFVHLSEALGVPLIPVFNSANKTGILIDAVTTQAGGTVNVTSVFAELSPT
jgi:hypothetical protein